MKNAKWRTQGTSLRRVKFKSPAAFIFVCSLAPPPKKTKNTRLFFLSKLMLKLHLPRVWKRTKANLRERIKHTTQGAVTNLGEIQVQYHLAVSHQRRLKRFRSHFLKIRGELENKGFSGGKSWEKDTLAVMTTVLDLWQGLCSYCTFKGWVRLRYTSHCSSPVSGDTLHRRGVSQAGKHLIVSKQKTFFIEVERWPSSASSLL